MNILIYSLKGLLEYYRLFQIAIRIHAKYILVTVKELHSLLLLEELSLNEPSSPTQFNATAFIANFNGSNK